MPKREISELLDFRKFFITKPLIFSSSCFRIISFRKVPYRFAQHISLTYAHVESGTYAYAEHKKKLRAGVC